MKHKTIVLIETVLAIIAFSISIPLVRHAAADWNNAKAVQKAETHPDEAYSFQIKAERLNPDNPVIHLNLGLLYSYQAGGVSLEDFLQDKCYPIPDSTVLEFEKAVALSRNEPIPLLNSAFVSAVNGNKAKAERLLEPLVRQKQCWTPVMVLYGILLEKQGDVDMAQKVYADAVAQAPVILESGFFSDLMGRDSLLAKSVVSAAKNIILKEYDRANNPLNTAILGELEYIEGDVDIAEKYLKEALGAIPSMNRPWMFLGRIEETRGNSEEALDYYDRAVQLDEYDALPVYFKAHVEGKASVMAEQMMYLMSLEPRFGLRRRYGTLPLTAPLLVQGFDRYCTYDYVTEIEQDRNERNVTIMNDVMASLANESDKTVHNLTAATAEKMLGIPYEAGILDIYPEKLRVYLDRTDNIHFIETCLAMALTANGISLGGNKNPEIIPYDLLCDNIRMLRYRDGNVTKFSDRIFYFTEWSEQAIALGLIEEMSKQSGHEYDQSFSYLSDHLMFLTQIAREPEAREEILEIENNLSGLNPFFAISLPEMAQEYYELLQDGDIVAFVSDRKGEDFSKIGIVRKVDNTVQLISASFKEKKVISEDFMQLSHSYKSARIFRILL